MKKLLSTFLVLVLALSAFAVTASANLSECNPSKISMVDTREGDLVFTDSTYITNTAWQKEDSSKPGGGVGITARTIDASAITASTIVASSGADPSTAKIRTFADNGNTDDGTSLCFKNNLIWQFDFKFTDVPDFSFNSTKNNDTNAFTIQFGSNWRNAIKFVGLNDSKNNYPTKYQIYWAAGYDKGTDGKFPAEKFISSPSHGSAFYANGVCALEKDKTYRMKIEVDARDTGKVYVTFINPYVNAKPNASAALGYDFSKLSEANWDNPYIYTKTTVSAFPIGFEPTAESIKGLYSGNYTITVKANSTAKVELSNERVFVDKYWVATPEISLGTGNNTVVASVDTINTTNGTYNEAIPSLICAVYNNTTGELAGYNITTPNQKVTSLTDNNYESEVSLSTLADGTYTVKAFVWNSIDEMNPYENCLATKTLTVTGGTGSLE